MKFSVAIALLILSIPAASFADDAKPTAKAKADPDALICKKQETTGTRLGAKRVCYTRDDWMKVNAYARAAVDHIQQQEVAPFGH